MSERKLKLGTQYREATFLREDVATDDRTLTLSFSSENPVERFYGMEILGHGSDEVDFGRLNNKAAMLDNHDPERQIGVVEKAWIEGGNGRAKVRFSRNAIAEEVFRDVQDGIRTKVSVGYRVNAARLVSEKEGVATYRMSWTPYEVSLVSIPADDSVGVGRNAAESETEVTITEDNMNKRLLNPDASGGGGTPATAAKIEVNEDAIRNAHKEAAKRASDILTIGSKWNVKPEDTQRFIAEGKSVEQFREFILENQPAAKPLKAESPEIGMSKKERDAFSIRKAIAAIANGDKLDGLEREASDAAIKRYHFSDTKPNGFMIPHDVAIHRSNAVPLTQRSTQVAGTANLGGFTVDTQMGTMIEYLRNRTALGQLGVTMLSGLTGNIVFPVQTGGATGYWVSENGSITASNATFGQKAMTPHRLGAKIDLSLQLINQSSLDIEAWARQEIMTVLALAKDLAGFFGSGVSGEPLGLANTTGINATVTYSAAAVWADVVEHETGIAVDNADIGTMGFALSGATVGKWKTILKDAVAGAGYLIEGGGNNMTAGGYPVVRSNQLSSTNQSFFGVWSQLILGSWAGQYVIVDPYGTNADTGVVSVSIQELCDVLVRQPLAFNVSTDSAAQ